MDAKESLDGELTSASTGITVSVRPSRNAGGRLAAESVTTAMRGIVLQRLKPAPERTDALAWRATDGRHLRF